MPARTVTTPSLRVEKLEADIDKSLTKTMKDRLGLKSQSEAARRCAGNHQGRRRLCQPGVHRGHDRAGSIRDRHRSGAGIGARPFRPESGCSPAGLDHIAGSNDVKKILARRAEMLALKKQTLEAAGFTTEEAMEILLADIAARG